VWGGPNSFAGDALEIGLNYKLFLIINIKLCSWDRITGDRCGSSWAGAGVPAGVEGT
jgi:hypothetical protein